MRNEEPATQLRRLADHVYRTDFHRVFANLVRMDGDFDLAEDVLQEAFTAALIQWARDGVLLSFLEQRSLA